jgi:hydroxyethylthiazole kinase-like uncharacterized protein yjeF
VKLLSTQESRALDQLSRDKYGIPSYQLMTNAGEAVARSCVREWFGSFLRPLLVVAGKGNNGGDGMVAARCLKQNGAQVTVALLGRAAELKGDAARAFGDWKQAGGVTQEINDANSLAQAANGAGLIVDAIFGTGLNAPIRGLAGAAIDLINRAAVPVVAVDIASGINADQGTIMGSAVKASLTVTFGLPKFGHVSYPGADYCGRLEVADIGFSAQALAEIAPKGQWLELAEMGALWPRRAVASHKGTFGHPLIIAASRGKSGAAIMAALGALRVGAGLVTLAAPETALPGVTIAYPELMIEPMPEQEGHFAGAATIARLGGALTGKNVLVAGPGIGVSADTKELVEYLLCEGAAPNRPLVLDADGLNAVAEIGCSIVRRAKGPILLTPHPGEMARLLNLGTAAVNADRIGAARRLCEQTGATTLLKGARSVIANPDGAIYVNSSGNPGMGTPGMGDVLSGVLGGLLAQGLSPRDAMALGVFVHGHAADRVARRLAPVGFIAADLIAELPRALADVTAGAVRR